MQITYDVMRDPGFESRMLALIMLWGEKPLILCEDPAKAPAKNFGPEEADNPAAAETFLAMAVQLFTKGV